MKTEKNKNFPLAPRLRWLREDTGMLRVDLARKLDITYQLYCDWERGAKRPSYEKLIKVADYYGVSLDYLLGRTERRIAMTK